MELFKDRLALLVEQSGLNLSQIAKDTGIAKSSLHNYLVGTEPTMTKLAVLADYFRVSADYLVFGKEAADPVKELLRDEVFKGAYEITVKRITKGRNER